MTDKLLKIVHLDCARKYFSIDNIKKLIDHISSCGYNQLELYLSDNQGFRFGLDDMMITTAYGTYDLTKALGDGVKEETKEMYPDGSGKYLTQTEMDAIIVYAREKGIEIVPSVNMPGHMGTILKAFEQFKWNNSISALDVTNPEAVAFGLAILEKYANYFRENGCQCFNVGADEFANDIQTNGYALLVEKGDYPDFVTYMNRCASLLKSKGMIPWMFNDGLLLDDVSVIDKDYRVCYWYNTSDRDVQQVMDAGYRIINTDYHLYWVIQKLDGDWKLMAEEAKEFDCTRCLGVPLGDSQIGTMMCIWCDKADDDGQDDGDAVIEETKMVIEALASVL